MKKENNLPNSKELIPIIPPWLIWIQCIAFIALYSVWILPDIVGVRNTAMVIGAIAGIYPIYISRKFFFYKSAITFWAILGIFIWATIHLFFLTPNFDAQLTEYQRIWKYALISTLFATGLGISLAFTSDKKPYYLVITGLVFPSLIYSIKYILNISIESNYLLDFCLLITQSSLDDCYIPKHDYVAFCLPGFAVICGIIYRKLLQKTLTLKNSWIYVLLLIIILFIFYNQLTKNGFLYSIIILIILFIKILRNNFINKNEDIKVLYFFILIIFTLIIANLFVYNSWLSFVSDAKVAIQLEKYPHWLFSGEIGWPINDQGKMVATTNYERVAWFVYGLKIIPEYFFGYGLIEDSFEHIVRFDYPYASNKLSHSHSGWLDLYLGVGFYAIIIFFILCLTIIKTKKSINPISILIHWSCIAFALMWITTELSSNITFIQLIFWVTFCTIFLIADKYISISKKHILPK